MAMTEVGLRTISWYSQLIICHLPRLLPPGFHTEEGRGTNPLHRTISWSCFWKCSENAFQGFRMQHFLGEDPPDPYWKLACALDTLLSPFFSFCVSQYSGYGSNINMEIRTKLPKLNSELPIVPCSSTEYYTSATLNVYNLDWLSLSIS
jgi:hypothetical protein